MKYFETPDTAPPYETGTLAVFVTVPEHERRNKCHDIAEAYAVEVHPDIPGGCIIWGRYHGEWRANVSGRWLLSQFISASAGLRHTDADSEPWDDAIETLQSLMANY